MKMKPLNEMTLEPAVFDCGSQVALAAGPACVSSSSSEEESCPIVPKLVSESEESQASSFSSTKIFIFDRFHVILVY